jgi:hypothetical protein
MERITEKMLQNKVDYLNKITGNPMAPWEKTQTGITANIGNYHLSYADGGVSLHQMMNEHGGVHEHLGTGHGPKRQLFDKLCAYIQGIESK